MRRFKGGRGELGQKEYSTPGSCLFSWLPSFVELFFFAFLVLPNGLLGNMFHFFQAS